MSSAVLGIDTSGTSCSVALVHASRIVERRAVVGNAHSQHVLTMVRNVLLEASLSLEQCSAVAYAAGPGSFTGLRIACAVAQGLAFGAGLPVVPIGTLDAIAHSAITMLNRPEGKILVAMDARMGEVYWSLVEWSEYRSIAATPPALASATTLRSLLAEQSKTPIPSGCGNAWSVYADAMHGLVEQLVVRDAADAVDVAQLGCIAYEQDRTIAPEDAAPLYVRNDVALTMIERAAARDAQNPSESARRLATAVHARSNAS